MERVALLVEDTQESVRCLLNPDSLVIRRASGLRPRAFEILIRSLRILRSPSCLWPGSHRFQVLP